MLERGRLCFLAFLNRSCELADERIHMRLCVAKRDRGFETSQDMKFSLSRIVKPGLAGQNRSLHRNRSPEVRNLWDEISPSESLRGDTDDRKHGAPNRHSSS